MFYLAKNKYYFNFEAKQELTISSKPDPACVRLKNLHLQKSFKVSITPILESVCFLCSGCWH